MYWISIIIGILIVGAELVAARRNRLVRSRNSTISKLWISAHQARWFWGLSTALLSLFITYPYPSLEANGEKLLVSGFPFIVGVFGQHGRDFVSSPEIVIATLAANAAVWFFVPSLILWIWASTIRTRS